MPYNEEVDKVADQLATANKVVGPKHPVAQGVGAAVKANISLKKLYNLCQLSENFERLQDEGFSDTAAKVGAVGGCAAGGAAFVGGAALLGIGVVALETPPLSAAGFAAGSMLMGKMGESSKLARHYLPRLVDDSIDKYQYLYQSSKNFMFSAYQKWFGDKNLQTKQYADVESAMLDLGFKDHTKELFSQYNDGQQLIYSAVTRDLFNQYFKLNSDNTVAIKDNVNVQQPQGAVDNIKLAEELTQIQGKLTDEKNLAAVVKVQNKGLEQQLKPVVEQINGKKVAAPTIVKPETKTMVQNAAEFCEAFQVVGQGVALAANITGNNKLARTVLNGSIAASQVVMGLTNIAQNGLSMGPVGLVLGGVNMLIGCFAEDNSGEAFEALAEQLAVISSQIHALHEDMLINFERVFTALGVINSNILEGFKLLHQDNKNILRNLKQLQQDLTFLQNNLNAVGKDVAALRTELRGYVYEDDRKQFELLLNKAKEESKRPFNRLKLQPKVLAGFNTFNVELVAKQLNANPPTTAEISRAFKADLGSAEANIGLLLNYAKNTLKLEVKEPIADPNQWQKCVNLLIEMVQKDRERAALGDIIGIADFNDFKTLKQIGDNWLALIKLLMPEPGKQGVLATLFSQYKAKVKTLSDLLDAKVKDFEIEYIQNKKQPHKGLEEYEKQADFAYNFKRNNAFITLTADWSYCKGFNNGARNMDYEHYYGEWTTHLQARNAEIKKKMESYKVDIEAQVKRYQAGSMGLFNDVALEQVFVSSFIVHQNSPDKMPLLPLLPELNGIQFSQWALKAQMLHLGHITQTYHYSHGNFYCNLKFNWANDKLTSVPLGTVAIPCQPLSHLNPDESAWHEYMGGTYPKDANYAVRQGGASSHNGDYYVRNDCAVPAMQAFTGLRGNDALKEKTTISLESENPIFKQRVVEKTKELRQKLNAELLTQLGASDTNSPLVKALQEVDASAKMLLAFLSIVTREHYQRPPEVWTQNEVLDYVQHYRGQSNYIHHQLIANIEQLGDVETELTKELEQQQDIAYTPVKDALAQLDAFVKAYEDRVVNDEVLDAEQKAKQSGDAALFGAAQAAMLIQNELIRAGHNDAAMHVADLLLQNGLARLRIGDGNPQGPFAQNQPLLFMRNNALPPPRAQQGAVVDEDREKERENKFGM